MAASDNYSPGREQVQVTAAPNISTVQARFDTAPTDTLGQLARALNIAAPAAENAVKTYEAVETVKGTQAANGMTLEEQRKMIANKQLMESHSSAYVATVQHMYGQNSMDRAKRETLDGIAKGTLSFPDAASLDKHITEQRNTALDGQSKYTIAGFDKGLDTFVSSAGAVNSSKVNADFVDRAQAERDTHIRNTTKSVLASDFKGTDADRASVIMGAFGLSKDTAVLPLAQSKASYLSMLADVAASGNTELMKLLQDSTTGDGHKVSAIIGGSHSRILEAQTEAAYTVKERQALDLELAPFTTAMSNGELDLKKWDALRVKYEKIFTNERWQAGKDRNAAVLHGLSKEADKIRLASVINSFNTEQTDSMKEAVMSGNYGTRRAGTRMNSVGDQNPHEEKDEAAQWQLDWAKSIGMHPDDLMKLYSTNGLVNPELKKEGTAAMGNLSSVGWKYNGKDIGVLSPQAEAGIKKLLDVYRVDPTNLAAYAGSKEAAEDVVAIAQTMHEGGAGGVLSEAASQVNAAKHSGIKETDFSIKRSEINSRVAAMVNPGLTSSTVTAVGNLFTRRNEQVNEVEMEVSLRRGAERLLKSGRASTVKEALTAMQKYQSRPEVTTVIDNTRYFNTDLPAVPQGANQADYVKLFKKEVIARDYGDKPIDMPTIGSVVLTYASVLNPALHIGKPGSSNDGRDIVLHQEGSGNYIAKLGAFPAYGKEGVLRYTKADIEVWIRDRYKTDQAAELAASNKALSQKQERAKGQLSGTTPSLSSGIPYSEN